MPSSRFRRLAPAGLLVAALALTGCQTYTEQSSGRDAALRSGDLSVAVAQADHDAARHKDSRDAVIHRLEQGAILRSAALANLPLAPGFDLATLPATAGHTQTNTALLAAAPEQISPRIAYLARSLAAFDEAARRIDDFDAQAKISFGSESAAMLTNQANLPYRGRAYDKVMLHTYQAFNYLHLRDGDAARVEINRALQRQRDAVKANARRIQEAQDLAAKARAGTIRDEQGRPGQPYDVERAKADPVTAGTLANLERRLDAAILPYGDYVNPFTTFLDALVFTHQALDASDLERARLSWQRVVTFAPSNPYARADHQAADPDLQVPGSPAPLATAGHGLTYVIFETGSAPYRDQVRIEIPLFLVTSRVSYAGAAFPRIVTIGGHAQRLSIATSSGEGFNTALVASMDSVVAQDFKNEWPTILTKTLISTATKATIDAIIQKQVEDQMSPTGALLFKVASAAAQAAINIADTRTWRSLPKEFQYARIATPADRVLALSAAGQTATIQLEPAAVNVVYVKSPAAAAPLQATQFVLKN